MKKAKREVTNKKTPVVIDFEGNEFRLQASITNEKEVNGNQSLSSTIYASKTNLEFINDITEMWRIIDFEDVEHKIIYVKKSGVGDKLKVEIKAIPLFFDVMDTSRIYKRYDEHMTARKALDRIFKDTGYGYNLVDKFDSVEWEGFGDGETRLETFKRALERYKMEFRIVGNTIYLENQIGRDTQIMYSHRLNASNIEQEIDAESRYTYAEGYGDFGDGDGGEDWQDHKLKRTYTSPLAKILGKRDAPPIKNGNITTKEKMDKELKTLVDESLKISISADIYDLQKQNYPIGQSEIGDRVFIVDERIGLNDETRVISQESTKNFKGKIVDLNITFGSESIRKRHQANIETAAKEITDWINGRKPISFDFLDDAVKNATKALHDAQTELNFSDNGILAIDKTDPNLLTLFNSAGLGVSDDGGNTFKNAITGNGINATAIATGILKSITVDSVDIYGSYIEGSEFYSGSATKYTQIKNSYIESRGTHQREWQGSKTNHDVVIKHEDGYLRARNNDEQWSVYLSDWGISSQIDGGNPDKAASGYMEFHSSVYSPSGSDSGLTLGSSAGRLAMETQEASIFIIPRHGELYVGNPNSSSYDTYYYNVRADQVYATAIRQHPDDAWKGKHLYLGVSDSEDAEVRVTNFNLSDGGYRPLRASRFYGSQLINSESDRFLYLGSAMGVRIASRGTNNNDPVVYNNIYAKDFKQRSSEKSKENISECDINGIEEINKLVLKSFNYEGDKNRINGFIAEENPSISDEDEEGEFISHGDLLSKLTKGVQELTGRIEELEAQING